MDLEAGSSERWAPGEIRAATKAAIEARSSLPAAMPARKMRAQSYASGEYRAGSVPYLALNSFWNSGFTSGGAPVAVRYAPSPLAPALIAAE